MLDGFFSAGRRPLTAKRRKDVTRSPVRRVMSVSGFIVQIRNDFRLAGTPRPGGNRLSQLVNDVLRFRTHTVALPFTSNVIRIQGDTMHKETYG
jgi:hypothetical protein